MNEETTTVETPVEEPVAEEAPASTESDAIVEELNTLGHRLAATLQKAWESGQRREIEREIKEGLRKAGDRIDEAAEELRQAEVTKGLRTQAAKVVDTVEETRVAQEVRKGLLNSLRRLNAELTRLLERQDEAEPEAAAEPETAAE